MFGILHIPQRLTFFCSVTIIPLVKSLRRASCPFSYILHLFAKASQFTPGGSWNRVKASAFFCLSFARLPLINPI